jgi:hypothetical protein
MNQPSSVQTPVWPGQNLALMQRWERWALVSLVLLYLAAGTVYSLANPVLESPDESFHFFVIKHIVDYRSLPVQREEVRGLWEQEGSQPPLYYLIGALLVSGIDLSDAETLLWHNPQANIGDPLNPGNKNLYIHPPVQRFPWHGAVLAIHVLRFFSLALGAVTVVLICCTTHLVFPDQGGLSIAAAATAAFVPQFLFITSSVNNDNAMTCLGTLSLYSLLRLVREGAEADFRSRGFGGLRWIGLGVVIGLALLSKLSALALLGMAGAVVLMVAWHQRSWRVLVQLMIRVGGPIVVISGWWYVRNMLLYGDLGGLSAMWEVVGRREGFGIDLWGEFRGLRYSFWGLFGWFSIALPIWIYRVLDVFTILAVAGFGLEIGRWLRRGLWRGAWNACRFREPGWGAAYRPLAMGLMAVWLGVVFVSLVRWTSLTEGSQGRLLYPALAPIALFTVLGLRSWLGRDARWAVSVAVAATMMVLGSVAPWLWIAPQYAHPEPIPGLPQGAIALDVSFGEAITLRGVGFERDVVRPGEAFKVDLYWETARSLQDEQEAVVWLRMIEERPSPDDPARGVVGLEDSYPGAGNLPTSLWPVDRLLASRQYVRVGADTPAPMLARLDIALYGETSGQRLGHAGEDLPTIGRVKVVPQRWPKVNSNESVARFECGVSLSAVEFAEAVYPGQSIPVTLTWAVRNAPQRDYSVFVHLEDEQGHVWGYGDGAPRGGNYPTWCWAEGEVIVDEHALVVAEDIPPGTYHITVGLYDSGGRVVAFGGDGARLANDAVVLGRVEVHHS